MGPISPPLTPKWPPGPYLRLWGAYGPLVGLSAHLWVPMGTYGALMWHLWGADGAQCAPMGLPGPLWVSMGTYGALVGH